ncbi:MAG: Hpt domain-containing protein [Desulfatitalea sp.]|nr:Hpt domain-containing protein [Desulfatitalea sp.]
MANDRPILDLDDALNRALGDAAFLKMMFDEFHQMIPEMLVTMTRAIEAGDLVSLGKSAHQLKGAAANLGATAVSAAALALERIGKSGNSSDVHVALDRLNSAQQALFEYIDRIDWGALGEK